MALETILSSLAFLSDPYVMIVTAIWTLFWKGWALWKAGSKKDKIWFIILLVVNTLGILEIVYIFFISKMKPKRKK